MKAPLKVLRDEMFLSVVTKTTAIRHLCMLRLMIVSTAETCSACKCLFYYIRKQSWVWTERTLTLIYNLCKTQRKVRNSEEEKTLSKHMFRERMEIYLK